MMNLMSLTFYAFDATDDEDGLWPADSVEPEDADDLDEDDEEDGSARTKHLEHHYDCDDNYGYNYENCDDDSYNEEDNDVDLEHGDEVPPPVGEGGQGAQVDSSEQSCHKPLSEDEH